MEHLPSPLHSLLDGQIEISHVCRKSYDGGPFLTYPVREGKGYVLPATSSTSGQLPFWQHEKLHPTPKDELESFFQTWLFFGLLHEVLGDLHSPQDFIRASQEPPDQLISTSKLINITEAWVSKVINGKLATTYEHLAECLRVTYAALRAVNPAFDQRIKVSIASTGELLAFAVNKAFHIENMARDNKCPASWLSLIDEVPWTEIMRAAGWCPSQISILCHGALFIQSLYYFTGLRQPESPSRHQSCSKQKCVAYQNNLEKYTTQHSSNDCKCEELSVDDGAVEDVLLKGQIPLLRIIPGQSLSDLNLEIISSQTGSQYVALSHVWADGLGNPYANALPRCQLLRLLGLLQRSNIPRDSGDSEQELLLWCDTLCCPVKPSEAKTRALVQMKRTYQDATMVLVLDVSLQLFNGGLLTAEEICTRISSSGWTRRLWTLQEGALGADNERLWFQFRDRAFNIHPLWLRVLEIFDKEIGRMGLASAISRQTKTLTTLISRGSNDQKGDLAMMEAALRHRSVSVGTDEPHLIANLLGLDLEEILNGPAETRVYRMWSLMPSIRQGIPKSIIFRLGSRLSREGFRWAPESLLDRDEDVNETLLTMGDGNNQGIPSPRGLYVSYPGYSLSFPSRPKGLPPNPWNIMREKKLLYMRDEYGAWYLVRRRESKTPSARGDFLTEEELCAITQSNDNFRIIDPETEFQDRTDGVQQTRTSLLVKLVQEEGDTNYVQSFMHIIVAILQKANSDMFEAAYQCAQQLKESSSARQMMTLQDHEVDPDLPSYKTLFDGLGNEIHRIAMMAANEAGLAASKRISGRADSALFEAIISLLFAGHFIHMGRKIHATQRWCVD